MKRNAMNRRDFLATALRSTVLTALSAHAFAYAPKKEKSRVKAEAESLPRTEFQMHVYKHWDKVTGRIQSKVNSILLNEKKVKALMAQVEIDLKIKPKEKAAQFQKFRSNLKRANYDELEEIVAKKDAVIAALSYLLEAEEKSQKPTKKNRNLKALEEYYTQQRDEALRELFIKLDEDVIRILYREREE
ncbi:MAG TPA: hypothetical protein VFF13_03940 [archaeon]|nr:hypothetical protein [archaeon]